MEILFEKDSIGIMMHDVKNRLIFFRIADIDNGEIVNIRHDPTVDPRVYQDRKRIFANGAHPKEGELGIWNWKSFPKDKDPTKEFTHSQWMEGAELPYEIIKISGAKSINQLIKKVKEGVSININSHNLIFILDSYERYQYEGICCSKEALNFYNGQVTFKPEIDKIPQITISSDEIITLQIEVKGTTFSLYKYLSVPQYSRFIAIKSADEIVLEIIKNRCTWAACKEKGLTRNEFQHMNEYIGELPDALLYEEIAQRANITVGEAEQIAQEQIQKLSYYFTQTNKEEQLLDNLILSHEGLKNRFANLAKEQWEKEHAEYIKKVQDDLQQKQKECSELQSSINSKKEQYQKLKTEYDKKKQIEQDHLALIKEEITQKQKYSEDLTTQVQKTLSEAQKHAAEFMAKWVVNSSLSQMNTKSLDTPNQPLFYEGLSASEIEEDTSWEETRDRMDGNLYEIGAADTWSLPLATLFYAFSKTNTPILLVGPCTDAIVDAISCSLYGRFADVLTLDSSIDTRFIQKLENKKSSIIRVDGVLDSNTLTCATKLLKDKKHQYIFTHPFVEDLRLLPSSLLNYIQVLFTEPFIDMQNSTPQLVGGVKSDDFQDISWFKEKALDSWPSLKLHTPPLFSAHLQELQKQMDSMKSKSEPFNQAMALGLYLPCFYMLDRPEALESEEFSKLGLDFDPWIKRLWGENK